MTEPFDPSGGDPGRAGTCSFSPTSPARLPAKRSAASPTPVTASFTSRAFLGHDQRACCSSRTALGLALNLDVHEIGVVILGDFSGIEEGQEVKRTGEVLSVPVGDEFLGRVVNPLGQAIDGLGEITTSSAAPSNASRPLGRPAQVGPRAAADRPQGRRRDDPDRPRPAPGHHRHRPDRQVHGRGRHDHQPEAELGVRRPAAAGALHLRRDRPGRPGPSRPSAAPSRRPARWSTPPSSPPRSDSAGFKYRALHRLGHRPAPDVRRHVLIVSPTTCPSRPRPTAPCRCCCAARRAARPTPATSSTCTRVCSSAARSLRTTSAPAP